MGFQHYSHHSMLCLPLNLVRHLCCCPTSKGCSLCHLMSCHTPCTVEDAFGLTGPYGSLTPCALMVDGCINVRVRVLGYSGAPSRAGSGLERKGCHCMHATAKCCSWHLLSASSCACTACSQRIKFWGAACSRVCWTAQPRHYLHATS